jgi:hypothetical protein
VIEGLLLVVVALQLASLALQLDARRRAPDVAATAPTSSAPREAAPMTAPDAHAAAERWTAALQQAGAAGWSPALPDGAEILRRCEVSTASLVITGWLDAWGRAARAGLDELDVDRRDLATRGLLTAASELVSRLDASLTLDIRPPPSVGPRHRARWLVDEPLARRLGREPVAGVLQPRLLLRPALCRGDLVLVEGEVC